MDERSSLTWKSISEEDRSNLRKVYQNFDKLWEFSCKANKNIFVYIFGENLQKIRNKSDFIFV